VITHVLGTYAVTLAESVRRITEGERELAFPVGDPFEDDERRGRSVEELLVEVDEAAQAALDAVRGVPQAARDEMVTTPVGEFTAHRFMEVALIHHTDRHTLQLQRIDAALEAGHRASEPIPPAPPPAEEPEA
jgi:hypothetical protein